MGNYQQLNKSEFSYKKDSIILSTTKINLVNIKNYNQSV